MIETITGWIPESWLAAGEKGRDGASCGRLYTTIYWSASKRRDRLSRRRFVPAEYTYDYAIVRIVPRVERGERINVGVMLSCVDPDFLDARIELDPARLLALDAGLDVDAIKATSRPFPRCARAARTQARSARCARAIASAGSCRRAARLSKCRACTPVARADPAATLEHLLDTMVRHNSP